MRIIITHKQYDYILLEQAPEGTMDRRLGIEKRNIEALGMNPNNYSDIQKYRENVFGKPLTAHEWLTILQIGTAFIPIAGPFISAGIGLADAGLYYSEGDKNSATLVGVFSMLPFISKIPGVKELGTKGMALLASKLIKGGKYLSQAETEIVRVVQRYAPAIKEELQKMSPKLSKIQKDLDLYKANFIKKYGQKEYDDLIVDYLYDEIDKKTFINKLKEVKNPNIRVKSVVGGGADHRIFNSTTNPNVVFKVEIRPGEVDKWYETFTKHPDVFAKTTKKTAIKTAEGETLKAVAMEKLKTLPFMGLWDDIEKVLQATQRSLPYNSQVSLERLLKNINKYPQYKQTWNTVIQTIKKNSPQISNKVEEFNELINKLYKILNSPDIRKFNFGYDTNNILKSLDL